MLQRFRTLFNLPSAIRGSISKGEYDLAVREYRKAKSIVLPSHVHNNLILHCIAWLLYLSFSLDLYPSHEYLIELCYVTICLELRFFQLLCRLSFFVLSLLMEYWHAS